MTQNTATAAQPRRHRTVTVYGDLTVNLALWRVLYWAVAVTGLVVGVTAQALNGQTTLAFVFFGVFAWMASRRFSA